MARCLGKTHAELMATMTWDELRHWIAFERVEPFEDGWIQSAELISMVYNLVPGKGPLLKREDVYPHLKRERSSTDWNANLFVAQMSSWAHAHNAALKAKGGA